MYALKNVKNYSFELFSYTNLTCYSLLNIFKTYFADRGKKTQFKLGN